MTSKILRTLLLCFLLLPCAATVPAKGANRSDKEVIDSLQGVLTITLSPADSIKPLYGIFDRIFNNQRTEVASKLYRAAKNSHNTEVQLDMLRHLTNLCWRNDSAIALIRQEVDRLPVSPEQLETKLFIDMHISDNLMQSQTPETQGEQLVEYIRRHSNNLPDNDYDRASLLYAVCRYLALETQAELLEDYVDNLEKLVDDLDMPDGAVRRLIYNRAAPIFYNNENYTRCFETDLKQLAEIDSLEERYRRQGRQYHNADIFRYTSYRRMLGCYKALTPEQIEHYYTTAMEMAKTNKTIAADIHRHQRIPIYYAMATGDFAKAKSLLLKQIDNPHHRAYRMQMLKMLKESALATGDTNALHRASLAMDDEFDTQLGNRRQNRSSELKIIYDLTELKHREATQELKRQRATARARAWIIGIGTVLVLLFGVLAWMLYLQNRRNKRLAAKLSESNKQLRAERDAIRSTQHELIALRDKADSADRKKTEFINNMSHEIKVPLAAIAEYSQLITDCIPDAQRAYLSRFSSIITMNVGMVTRLVNDVLDVAQAENGQMSVQKHPVAVSDICTMAIDNAFDKGVPSKEDVTFLFNAAGAPDIIIDTDEQRVVQVLVNLLSNAEKFSEHGTISLDYTTSPDGRTITFAVADHGIGIPAGQEEAIFDRFKRLDPTGHGCGLGLYISRLVATLLDGTLTVDTSYRGGARFLFTIPTGK